MSYMISSRSLADRVSLSLMKSKLVYSKLFYLSGEFCVFEDKYMSKANGVYDTIIHFACNFDKCSPI